MAVVRFEGSITFVGDESWAQGEAQWLLDTLANRMVFAEHAHPGTAQQETPWGRVTVVEDDDGEPGEVVAGKWLDEDGEVREGEPDE